MSGVTCSDDHEQRGRPGLHLVANLLLELLVDGVLREVAEEGAESGAQGQPHDREEEAQAEQQSPETAPPAVDAPPCVVVTWYFPCWSREIAATWSAWTISSRSGPCTVCLACSAVVSSGYAIAMSVAIGNPLAIEI